MEKPAGEPVYSVTQVNREARLLLEQAFPALWVSGELSNLSRPASGHLYFSLKDAQSQLRCAMFRGATARGLRFKPENGQQVLVRGRIGLYEPRGDFQLVVEHMEPAGDGLLLRRLEELKKKLAAEGLFDAARKRPLPALPRRIGVITSPSGAAVRDVLHVLRRRFPAVPVVIYPTAVQGELAKIEIAAAIETAAARNECDVLILARGGGSLEDLWAFNEEVVVRAIHACPIPIVSGVGHEIDFTLADLAADMRAPTPSGAAELVAPEWRSWLQRLIALEHTAMRLLVREAGHLRLRSEHLTQRLARTHPQFVLRQHTQRLDELSLGLATHLRRTMMMRRQQAGALLARLQSASPRALLQRRQDAHAHVRQRLAAAIRAQMREQGHQLGVAAASLQAFSPLRTLERGYAIVSDTATSVILRDSASLRPGQAVTARMGVGEFDAIVERIRR